MKSLEKSRKKFKVLDNEERESRNVNHIQRFCTSLFKEPQINVESTRSRAPVEPYPNIDENRGDPSNNKLMDTSNENDPRNKSIRDPHMVTKTTSTLVALCIIEVTQPIPIPLSISIVPPKQYIVLERTPLRANPQARSTDNRPKPPLYQIPHVRNSESKSNIKQPHVIKLATCLTTLCYYKRLR